MPRGSLGIVALAATLLFTGCSKPPAAPSGKAAKSEAHDDHDHGHDHGHGHDREKSEHGKVDPGEKQAAGDGHDHGTSEHDEHDHSDEQVGNAIARFDTDHGLQLAAETVAALGVQTAVVAPRTIAAKFEVTASVFDPGPPARASALVPVAAADLLERAHPRDPTLLAVRREMTAALGQAELILAAPSGAAVGQAVVLTLATAPRALPSVPRSAILRTATGTFVYVRGGEFWRRTPVETGGDDGAFVAILTGVQAGDVVATAAVEHLWLTELRLTKGGGHSH